MNSPQRKTHKTRYYTFFDDEYVELCIFNMATGSHLGFRPLAAIRSRFEKSTFVIFKGRWASNSNQVSKSLADDLYTGSWTGPGLYIRYCSEAFKLQRELIHFIATLLHSVSARIVNIGQPTSWLRPTFYWTTLYIR